MKTICTLTMSDARRAVDAATETARRHGWKVTIAVCDARGSLVLLERMDEASDVSVQLAPQKARTCILTGKSSKADEELVDRRGASRLSIPVTPIEGGEPVMMNGMMVGAVGVSGAKADEDGDVARAGVASLMPG